MQQKLTNTVLQDSHPPRPAQHTILRFSPEAGEMQLLDLEKGRKGDPCQGGQMGPGGR